MREAGSQGGSQAGRQAVRQAVTHLQTEAHLPHQREQLAVARPAVVPRPPLHRAPLRSAGRAAMVVGPASSSRAASQPYCRALHAVLAHTWSTQKSTCLPAS